MSKENQEELSKKKIEQEELSRRRFNLIAIGAGLLGVAGLAIYYLPKSAARNLSMREFMAQEIFGKKGPQFVHQYYSRNEASGDPYVMDAFNTLKGSLTQKFGTLEGLVPVRRAVCNELAVSEEVVKECEQRLTKLANQFYADLNIPRQQIRVQKLTKATQIERNDGIRDIFLVEQNEILYGFEKNGVMHDEVVGMKHSGAGGEVPYGLELNAQGNTVKLKLKRGPILVNLTKSTFGTDRDTLLSVSACLSELLHYHTVQYQTAHLEKELSKYVRPDGLPSEILNPAISKWLSIEEAVVHAATIKWLKQKWLPTQRDIKVPAEFLLGTLQAPQYRLLPKYFASKLEPKELLRLYKEDPEKLPQ